MQLFDITRTQYKVSDFLGWQRGETLDLAPEFQRRPVWKPGAKSYLIDTVVRGLPTPIIFLRDQVALPSLETVREVVDGQQRLRTLLAYISPDVIKDYDPDTDAVLIRRVHNRELAGLAFDDLPDEFKHRILNYQFSTHVLPTTVDDKEVLKIFSRLNSTGTQLSKQELRNAEWFGEFKTLMYELGLEQLDRWRRWHVLNVEEISRMKEAELTSDITLSMIEGYGGKSQPAIDKAYKKYDEAFPLADVVSRRFRRGMDAIDDLLGDAVSKTVYSRENWFVPLFVLLYRRLWPDGPIASDIGPKRLPGSLKARLMSASVRISDEDNIPQDVLAAIRGAATDKKRRRRRLDFLAELVDG